MPERAYDFGRRYQLGLLAMACREPAFLRSYRDIVDPLWFDDPVLADICRLACDYHREHRRGPTVAAIEQRLADMLAADQRRAQRKAEYDAAFAAIVEFDLIERDDIRNRAATFARNMAVIRALEESADKVDRQDYDGIVDILRGALATGQSRQDLGLDYFEDRTRLEQRREAEAISTGIPPLDDMLKGGLAPKEVGVVEAPPKRFKTGTLCNFGYGALRAGADVVHISLEVKAHRVSRRYDGAMLGMAHGLDRDSDIYAEVAKLRDTLRGRLMIKHWAMLTASADDIRGYLHALIAERKIAPGERPLMLIVDYGQIMRPTRHYNDKRHEHRENYQSLIQIADEFECAVWSAVQSNRGSVDKAIIDINDLSECFAIAADVDVVLSLSQTKDERRDDRARFYAAAVREAYSGKTVDVTIDFDLTRFSEVGAFVAPSRRRLSDRLADLPTGPRKAVRLSPPPGGAA